MSFKRLNLPEFPKGIPFSSVFSKKLHEYTNSRDICFVCHTYNAIPLFKYMIPVSVVFYIVSLQKRIIDMSVLILLLLIMKTITFYRRDILNKTSNLPSCPQTGRSLVKTKTSATQHLGYSWHYVMSTENERDKRGREGAYIHSWYSPLITLDVMEAIPRRLLVLEVWSVASIASIESDRDFTTSLGSMSVP